MSRPEHRERDRTRRGHGDDVFDPIWSRAEPAGRRAPQSRAEIAAAAIAVADVEGFEAVSMRRVARELGIGTMSLYHYVRSKDELMDLVSDAVMGVQLVDEAELRRGWRPALRAIATATRRNFEHHPWILAAMQPRPRQVPGPNSLRHFDQSVAAVVDLDVDLPTKMEIVALIDDYVFGFSLRAYLAGLEQRVEEAEPRWMQAVFDYMAIELETGAYPNVARIVEANRAAGGKDEDLPAMVLQEGRFERGLERLLDGIEVELKRRRGR
ncbi:MAG TPA: TetR/AcrR family transcriptional regulator [Solirubrobacteraceae bacterium]|jgi:AcrR family transcriptional regulator